MYNKFILFVVVFFSFISQVFAVPSYELTIINTTGPSAAGRGINDAGEVAGFYYTSAYHSHGFVWDETNGLKTPQMLGGTQTFILDINNNGQLAGHSRVMPNDAQHAAFWESKNNAPQDLNLINGNNFGEALAINNSGQVVGNLGGAFIWDSNNGLLNLGTFGGFSCQAFDINDKKEVVGSAKNSSHLSQAFFWDETNGLFNIGDLTGALESWALGINNNSEVVGTYLNQAFRWNQNDGLINLNIGRPEALNDNGIIVGSYNDSGNHASIWIDDARYTLDDLVVNAGNWTLKQAFDINTSGHGIQSGFR